MQYVVIEHLYGPEQSGNIRHCIRCHAEIEEHTQWLKVWAPDMSYAVGMCIDCAAHAGARSIKDPVAAVMAQPVAA